MESMGDLRAGLSDLSAHIVTRDIKKDGAGHGVIQRNKRNNVCILVSVVLNNNTVEGE